MSSAPNPNPLRSRIYNKGFSLIPLPSVQRPQSLYSSSEPLAVRLFSVKNQLAPLIYQTQPSILHKTSHSLCIKGNPSKIKKNSQIPNNWDHREEEEDEYEAGKREEAGGMEEGGWWKDEGGRKEEGKREGGWEKEGGRKEGGEEEGGGRKEEGRRKDEGGEWEEEGEVEARKLELLERKAVVSYGKDDKFYLSNEKFGDLLKNNDFFLRSSGDFKAIRTFGFEKTEMARSKTMLNKLSGKNFLDKRNMTKNEKKNLKSILPPLKKREEKGEGEEFKVENVQIAANQVKTEHIKTTRPVSRIDKYIELILKNVSNLDEFIYLEKKNDEDPYELDIIDYEKVKSGNTKDYYTISKKGFSHYVNGKPCDFIALAFWLKEREIYDQIKSLKFFKKFRKWKTLRMWKKNVVRHKTNKCKRNLEAKLFILDPVLRNTLLKHKELCEEMEKLRVLEHSQQQYGFTSEVPTISEFEGKQEQKMALVSDQIKDFSSQSRRNIATGFQASLAILRDSQKTERKGDNQEKEPIYKLKENSYEKLGFSEKISYEQISEVRKECIKFIRFSYLIDFLVLNSLKNIYLDSLEEMISEFSTCGRIKDNFIYREKSQKGANKYREPLFLIKIDFDFTSIPESSIVYNDISDYLPAPLGASQLKDFSLLTHIYIKTNPPSKSKSLEAEEVGGIAGGSLGKKEEGLDERRKEGEEEEEEEEGEGRVFLHPTFKDIAGLWLRTNPVLEEFMDTVKGCSVKALEALKNFERWSRHEDMEEYVNVLEEWDDMVGEDWNEEETKWLDPTEWLIGGRIEGSLGVLKAVGEEAYVRVEKYLKSFEEYLRICWEHSLFNIEIFKNDRLVREAESIENTLALLEYQKDKLENEIPFQGDLGLFRVDSNELREAVVPCAENVLKKLMAFFPEQLRNRTKTIKEWLAASSASLKMGTGTLEEFVRQRSSLKTIDSAFPSIRRKLDSLSQIYLHLKSHYFDIKKEDEQLFTEAMHAASSLQLTLTSASEALEKGIESNATKITTQLIPELMKSVNDLDFRVKDYRWLMKNGEQPNIVVELRKMMDDCVKLDENSNKYREFQKTLGMDEYDFEALRNVKEELEIRLSMWESLTEWKSQTQNWQGTSFSLIEAEEITSKAEYFTNIVRKAAKKLPSNGVLDELKSLVYDFKDTMPVVLALRNKHLKEYHWKEIKEIIGQEFEITESFKLRDLMDLNVGRFVKEIQEISTQATQESILERNYEEIMGNWLNLEFVVIPYKSDKAKELYLLTDMEDLFDIIDEFLANLNNIMGSRYLKNLRPKVEELHKKLLYTQETIDDWLVCQKNWIYLENIFDSQDIKKKLVAESSQFENVDKNFRNKMVKTNQMRLVHKCVTPDIGKIFKKQKETLNNIQKALENYLELKRTSFPRFYFLSNDELLEILANAANLNAIQKHMKKCFDNIYRLYMGDDNKTSTMISGMISGEGEKVEFYKPISTRSGEIELWLNGVQDQMRETISKKMRIGRNDLDSKDLKDRKKWVLDHPGQVIATISHISWCINTEEVLEQIVDSPAALFEWLNINVLQLGQLTELVRSNLDPIKHKIVVALITQDVHARDILEMMVNEGVMTKGDFMWQQQLRYYWDEGGEKENVYVLQVNAKLKYGYEYMGATSRLVITPLTDRCWITITGALNIKLGASPSGPAGTGKTESTKDLAKALGMFCVVFNCSEQIEYKMMSKLFSGLAQQGAWSCLDEFNRIDIEVLSVIAQQLLTIRQALLKGDKKFLFGGEFIMMREGFGVFITMNPGYAGRTELPDNLKVLFRPMAMMIPDYRLIAEIILFSEGFEDSKVLSNKMVQLYKLSSEQLSQQKHYDFGMRAVKSVLVMAGSLKRADPDSSENVVLIKAMRDSNLPKFLKEDIPLFQALLQDLFPDVVLPPSSSTSLSSAISFSFLSHNLQLVPPLQNKILQLFDTFNVRFGVMLVGLAGSGKTTCYQILQDAMSELRRKDDPDQNYQHVRTYILNPKCISMGELYGEVNQFTEEWQDGLASGILREVASDETADRKKDRHWVVFDGPVDALWIENMNTVLDDNMMLCLANGQRIKLRSEMRMLFEVNDLDVASPATVSRCGMVYLSPDELGWKPICHSWIDKMKKKLLMDDYFQNRELVENQNNLEAILRMESMDFINKNFSQILLPLFDEIIGELFIFIRTNPIFEEPIKTNNVQLISNLCNLLECLIAREHGFKVEDRNDIKKKFINHVFAFSLIWSISSSISEQGHFRIDDFVRKKFTNIIFPNTDNAYGFYIDFTSADFTFKPWHEITPPFIFDKDVPFYNMLVPTIDTTRYSYILEKMLCNEKRVFITGGTGVGKSVMIRTLLERIQEPKLIDPIYLIFSSATDSQTIQMTIEGKLVKQNKTIYGAKQGHKVVIFIDDINMPAVEKYGAQPPIELLRLMVDKGGMYDRKEHFWKEIQNTIILAAASPPNGGRNELTLRFTRHFHMLCIPQPNQKTLFKIFNSILFGFLNNGFQDVIKRYSENITQATIELYLKIIEEKKAIPSKFHYSFNLRDLSKVFQGLLMCRPGIIKEHESFFRLWIHEVTRVFHDRLIDDEDRDWFYKSMIDISSRHLNAKWTKEEIFIDQKILFSDLLKMDSSSRDYEEIRDIPKLIKVLDDKMDDYNFSPLNKSKLNLVFFDDAINHILRISRVLRQPRGNLMLIGVGGSGKQSLTKLASFLLGYTISQIEISKDYGLEKFREFLKDLLMNTGVQGKNVTFLFTDNQIVSESFLEDINNMLNSGEVPNIWENADEKGKIIESVRPIHISMKRPDIPDLIYSTFVERVRDRLHIVLCMSPVGSALRVRCRKFPSLVDCSTLNWFSAWPESALISVSSKILSDLSLPSEAIRKGLAWMCKEVHLSIGAVAIKFENVLKRRMFITPKSFLDLVALYVKLLEERREEIQTNCKRLENGVNKLFNANHLVAQLKVDLTKLQPELDLQNKNVNEALILLERDSGKAREQEIIVEREKEEINHKAEEIKAITEDAQADLEIVRPELEAAESAVKNIDIPSLTQMKSYAAPPQIVEDVMQGVCILLGKKYEWAVAKNLLNNINAFTAMLLNYPKDSIKDDILMKLRKHKNSVACFNPQEIKQRVLAAADLCSWCCAMDTYATVSKKVAPKKAKVHALQTKLESALTFLNEKEAEVFKVKESVLKLKTESDLMLHKKAETERLISQTTIRLSNAEKLTELLKEEGERWKTSIEKYHGELITIIGDVFLSASMVNYCGPLTGSFRQELMEKWIVKLYERNIPLSGEHVSVIKTLSNPINLREWLINGLPADSVSQENAIFAFKSSKYPLMIDPQGQALKWIRKTEEKTGLKIMKFTDTQFQTNLKSAITMGDPVLIPDVEEILDPIIDPILTKQVMQSNEGRSLIRFADQDLDFTPSFHLYLTCKKPNPSFLPEIFIKVNVINFTVTFDGLEDQLLAEVVKREKPAIEAARDENIINLSIFRRKIMESENLILKLLSEAKNDTLLDDVDLIKTLETSKLAALEVEVQIKNSVELEKSIEETRDVYRGVATRGSVLFFVIKDFAMVDPMYQYSLQYIAKLFNNSVENSKVSNKQEERLTNLIETITKNIYTNVSRGLFEQHKLLFSFMIASSIETQNNSLDPAMWNVFLRGAGIFDNKSQPKCVEGFPQNSWDLAYYLEINFKEFHGLTDSITNQYIIWKEHIQMFDSVTSKLPPPYSSLSPFCRLLLLKIFRPEKLLFGISSYVAKALSAYYLSSPEIRLLSILSETDPRTPLIFVLSQGADPTESVINISKERENESKLRIISLGQGQGIVAGRLIEEGRKEGNWVYLQNCHLARSWMPSLEVLLEETQQMKEVHKDFRLILTSMPTSYFPSSVLQNGVKLTTEPPRGLKANLRRAFQDLNNDYLDSCGKKEAFHKLIWGLSYFHAIVLERRKFGSLGWNIRYDFNDSDLGTSRTVLMMLLNEQENIPWDALLFVTGHINYGGRVTDEWDRRCLISILKRFYQADILEENYKFCDSDVFGIPKLGSMNDYRDYIEGMPAQDPPEVFGMHENANTFFEAQESERMLQTLLHMQPRLNQSSTGKSNDEKVLELLKSMLEEMPSFLIKENGNKELFTPNEGGLIPSLSTFLLQEMERFNKLIDKIVSSLKQLSNAIQGFGLMSEELDNIYYNLLNNKVPTTWEDYAYPSMKPLGSWVKDLKERVRILEDWLANGNPNCYWISGFFFPQGFLTGVLQTHARKFKIPIDQLQFNFKVLDDKENVIGKPIDGVYIYGLFLEGAIWDKKKKILANQNTNELTFRMPVIHFNPTENYEPKTTDYSCPVYKTSVRQGVLSTTGQSTNFIVSVDLSTSDEYTDFWTLRGTALIAQLNN